MQDNYSLCRGALLVMNWDTGNVCRPAGAVAGSVDGLHRGLRAGTLCTLCRRRDCGANRPRSPPPGQQPFCKLFWAREVVFLEQSLLPQRRYHHSVAEAEEGKEACRELVAFHPISGQVLPRQSTHKFMGESWISAEGPVLGFALLPAAWGNCQLTPAPCMQLGEAPAMATSPPPELPCFAESITVLLLLSCSKAWGKGECKLSLLPARMPGHAQSQPGWVSMLPGLYTLTAGGTGRIS